MTTGAPLRIAVWHNLPSGGAKRALFDHVRGLVARGHHVEAWCPPSADREYLPLSSLVDEHVLPMNLRPPKPLRALRRLRLRNDTRWNLRAIRKHSGLVGEAVGSRFDVLLASTCQLTSVPPIGLHAQIPTALYLQEPNRPLYEAMPTLPWLDRRSVARAAVRQARAELSSIAGYDRVLVNSRFSRESVLRAFGVSSEVCYLGVDTDLFRPAATPSRAFVIGVGAFTPSKQIDLALRAVADVQPQPPPLVWVGNAVATHTYISELEQLAAELGVDFTAKLSIPDSELVELISNARLLFYAPRLEPFGFAPLEANACGVPVVASAEGGVRESVINNRNGLLVEPSQRALAGGVEELWNDEGRAAAMGAAGRELVVKDWTTEKAVERLERELLQLRESDRGHIEP